MGAYSVRKALERQGYEDWMSPEVLEKERLAYQAYLEAKSKGEIPPSDKNKKNVRQIIDN